MIIHVHGILNNIFSGILGLLINAGAAMPLVILFSLIADNKKKGLLPEYFSSNAIRINMFISVTALAGLTTQAITLIKGLAGKGPGTHINPWQPAFMPWTLSCILWFLGCLCLMLMGNAANSAAKFPGGPCHSPRHKYVCIAAILAAMCFFSTFLSINWPFAGLPADMSLSRAFSAIFKNAFHTYYTGFTPAGASLLVLYALLMRKRLLNRNQPENTVSAIRWFAFWTIAGSFPYWLQNFGLVLGLGYHYGFSGNIVWKSVNLTLLTLSLVSWGAIFALGKKHLPGLLCSGWLALLLFYALRNLQNPL